MILALDDDVERLEALSSVGTLVGNGWTAYAWKTAPHMIREAPAHLAAARLITLDHDLDRMASPQENPGCGRDVANWLAGMRPVCPVIIHSSNTDAAWGMSNALSHAGWTVEIAHQINQPGWIRELWVPAARRLVAVHAPVSTGRVAAPDWLRGLLSDPTKDGIAQLKSELRGWPAGDAARALFTIAIGHDSTNSHYRAGDVLVDLEPAIEMSCEQALRAVAASNLDVDAQSFAFYLITQFGRRQLINTMIQLWPPAETRQLPTGVDALEYWLRPPAHSLLRRWGDWSADLK